MSFRNDYAAAVKAFLTNLDRRTKAAVWNAATNPAYRPSLTRDEWWEYWRTMNDACPQCRNARWSGGPSPVWPHVEHLQSKGYRMYRIT